MRWRTGSARDVNNLPIHAGDAVAALHVPGVWRVAETWKLPNAIRLLGWPVPQLWTGDMALRVTHESGTVCERGGRICLQERPFEASPRLGAPEPYPHLGRVAFRASRRPGWPHFVLAAWRNDVATLWGVAEGENGRRVPLVTVQPRSALRFEQNLVAVRVFNVHRGRCERPTGRASILTWLQETQWERVLHAPLYQP